MARNLAIFLLCLAGLAILGMPGTGPGAQPVQPSANGAGKVELVEGDVSVYNRVKAARKVKIGDPLYEGENVITGRDGELHLAMDDGGYLAVRPNTNMSIIAYQAQGRDDDRSILNLVAGSFRSITGWIGRHNPRSYQVRTPTATIGVRGTDHEPLVIPEGAKDAEPGTYDKVYAGGTVLESIAGHGRIEVTANRVGFAPLRGKPMPRLLAAVPRFYRPTRNEGRLLHRHQAVQKSADRLREDRRRMLDERRKAIQERKDARKIELNREHEQQRNDIEQRRDSQKNERAKWDKVKAQEQRVQQQQQRESRLEEKKQRSEERKPNSEPRRRDRESRDDAQRGRNRD